MDISRIYKEMIEYGKEISDKGLVKGTGGNISVRVNNIVISTPSGFSLEKLEKTEFCVSNLDGEILSGSNPTKELKMHLSVYNHRQDLNAVVHTHSANAVTYSCAAPANTLIPIYTPSMAAKVGNVKIVPFALPGSKELGDIVGEEIKSFNGLLLENHGVLSTGSDLTQAVNSAYEIEDNLRVAYISNHQARSLSSNLINDIINSYGGKK